MLRTSAPRADAAYIEEPDANLRAKERDGRCVCIRGLRKEFDTRPTFDLGQQIKMMDRGAGNSQVDAWFAQISIFMRETGALPTIPLTQDFVTGEYMNLVQADPKLREFANNAK